MFKNVLNKFIKAGAIALVGNLAAAIGFGITNYHTQGLNTVTQQIWDTVILSGSVAAVAAVERLIHWNPTP